MVFLLTIAYLAERRGRGSAGRQGWKQVRRVQGDADAGDATMTAPTTLALTTTLTMVASSSASRCSSTTAGQAEKLTVLHAL